MDLAIVLFFVVPFGFVWLHLSSYSLYFNFIASCVLALVLLYLVVATTYLLPVEQVLFLFYKDKIKSEPRKKKVAYDDEITRKTRELIGHIVRDFILDWYNTVSDDVHFVQESFELFEHVFCGIRTRISEVDAQIFVGHLLSFLSRHLACYQHALRHAERNSPNNEEKKRQLIIITYEKQLGHLAMSNYPDTETDHLRSLTAVLLKALLPRDYRLTGASLYVVRELISKNVLLPFIDILTKPDWINKNIVLVLGDHEEEIIEDSEDAESTSSESEDPEVVSQPLQPVLKSIPWPSASSKPNKDMAVAFSVADNVDFFDLDVEYEYPNSSVFNDATAIRSHSHSVPDLNQCSSEMFDIDKLSETGSNQTILDSNSDAGSIEEKRFEFHDDRFFQRIRIPSAMTIEEPFDGGSKYTLYTIEYSAPIYSQSHQTVDDVAVGDEVDHFQVKRRFREFLTLQERLNDKPLLRRLVRNVRAPSRMFPMPIGNMDKDYIEKRRKFLQAYLRELCSIPHVNNSNEIREFLSYKSDPRIAFVRRPSNYIPRFDKIFKSVVKDLFGAATDKLIDKFSATSSVEAEEIFFERPYTVTDASADVPPPSPGSLTSSCDVVHSASKARNPVAKLKNIVLGRSSESVVYEEGLRDFAPFTGSPNPNKVKLGKGWRNPQNILKNRTSYHAAGRRTQGDGCETHHFEYDHHKTEDPITGHIFRLVHQVWGVHVGTNTMLYSVLGRFVKKYVDIRIAALTDEQQWILYIKTIQNSLWPGGKWGERETILSDRALPEAQTALEDAFPDLLRHLVGSRRYSSGVEKLLASLQEPLINRHVAYHLLDLLIKLLFPDLPTVITQASNVSL